MLGFDVLMIWLPPGEAWLHEECYRAVVTRPCTSSYDEVYESALFADTIKARERW